MAYLGVRVGEAYQGHRCTYVYNDDYPEWES